MLVVVEPAAYPLLLHAVLIAVRPSRPNTARRVIASSNQPPLFVLPPSSSIVTSPSSQINDDPAFCVVLSNRYGGELLMRRVTYTLGVSRDGCILGPNGGFN